jgi:2,2-dialkylglycine decarboxylase (pyruvate)
MGARFGKGLCEIRDRHEIVGDVRGLGLLWGVEIVRDKVSRTEDHELAAVITSACMARGLIVGGAPPGGGVNVIRLAPPLVVRPDEIDEALEVLEAAVETAASLRG